MVETSGVIKKMIAYFGNDVQRINHTLQVYGYAKSIGELENLAQDQRRVVEVGAILHDIGIKESERKYSSTAWNYQEKEGPPVARDLLKEFNCESDFVDRICYIIGNHHTFSAIDGIDFQVIVEADLLVNIYGRSMDKTQIESVKEKHFKTNTGLVFLRDMYNV